MSRAWNWWWCDEPFVYACFEFVHMSLSHTQRGIFQCHQRIVSIPIHIGVAFFQSLEYTLSRTHTNDSTFSPIQRNKHSSQLAREKTSVAFSSLSKAFSPFPVSRHMLESLSSRKILYSMFKCLHPNRQHNSCKLTVVSNGTRIIQCVATDIVSLSKSRRLSAKTVAV